MTEGQSQTQAPSEVQAPRQTKVRSQAQGRSRAGYWLYLIPGALLLTVIIVIPLAWNVYLSFTRYRGIRPPIWIGLENWRELAQDSAFWASFQHSIAMVVAMVILPTLFGLLLASLLFDLVGRRFNGKVAGLLRAVYYLPQILPIAIAAIVVGWILRPEDGALNDLLAAIGLDSFQHNWLGSPDTALISVGLVLVWIQIGYPVVVFMSALQRIDPQLYEAAELDGANWFQRFRAITLSGIRPEIFVVVLTCTVASLKVFGPVYALTRGGPGDSTVVPSYYAYTEFFTAQRVGYGATIATALTLVVLVVAVFFVRAQFRLAAQEEQ